MNDFNHFNTRNRRAFYPDLPRRAAIDFERKIPSRKDRYKAVNDLRNEIALERAMEDMNLRETHTQGVYCEEHNPNKPAGDYSELRHYVWNVQTRKMEELPGVYFIRANGKDKDNNVINNAALQAIIQGYEPADIVGIYLKDDKEYKYNTQTCTFEEVTTGGNKKTSQDDLDKIMNDFITGNKTAADTENALSALGINCDRTDNNDNRVLTFEYNGYSYVITCNKAAANDGFGGNIVDTVSKNDLLSLKEECKVFHSELNLDSFFTSVVTRSAIGAEPATGDTEFYAFNPDSLPEEISPKTLAGLISYIRTPKQTKTQQVINEFLNKFLEEKTEDCDTLDGSEFKELINTLDKLGIEYNIDSQTLSVFNRQSTLTGIQFEYNGKTYTFFTTQKIEEPAEPNEPIEEPLEQLITYSKTELTNNYKLNDQTIKKLSDIGVISEIEDGSYNYNPDKAKELLGGVEAKNLEEFIEKFSANGLAANEKGMSPQLLAEYIIGPLNDKYVIDTQGITEQFGKDVADKIKTTDDLWHLLHADEFLKTVSKDKCGAAFDTFIKAYEDKDINALAKLREYGVSVQITMEFDGNLYAELAKRDNKNSMYYFIEVKNDPDAVENAGLNIGFVRAALKELSGNAVNKYFTTNDNKTYYMNSDAVKKDFPEQTYGHINTPKELAEAIEKSKTTGITTNTNSETDKNKQTELTSVFANTIFKTKNNLSVSEFTTLLDEYANKGDKNCKELKLLINTALTKCSVVNSYDSQDVIEAIIILINKSVDMTNTYPVTLSKEAMAKFEAKGLKNELEKIINGDELKYQYYCGVDGIFDDFCQGDYADCWLLSSVISLNHTEAGREILSECISVDETTHEITVTFKGLNKSYVIKPEEMIEARNPKSKYAYGDNDIIALECAVEQLRKDISAGKVKLDYGNYTGWDNEASLNGGSVQYLHYYLTGKTPTKYIQNKTGIISKNEIYDFLKDCKSKLEQGQEVLSFSVAAGKYNIKTEDGVFNVNFDKNHALSITKITDKTVTFINPWDSGKEYTVTWENFVKLNINKLVALPV